MDLIWGAVKGSGTLDYVTCWYKRAADYVSGTAIKTAFVSTNSISQGEQAGILWEHLFGTYHLKIHFAHRTFSWTSEAKGKAHVHVVIVGFGQQNPLKKRIYDYTGSSNEAVLVECFNISPYLTEGSDMTLRNRERPISAVPEIVFGCMPNDDGEFLFTDEERTAFLKVEPAAEPFFRRFISSHEFLHGETRWCLWLVDADPVLLRKCPHVLTRIEAVRTYRSLSTREATKKLALAPSLFGEIRAPSKRFVLIPRHSSETRRYIPISYFSPQNIPGDSCLFLENASLYHFGMLMSGIHMAWVRTVCGRIKSDYRYSNKLVYNNYPWPKSPADKQSEAVETCAQAVLDVRAKFPNATFADLYDPLSMPPALAKAHADLDRAVDRCYRAKPFASDRERVEHLFELYEQLTSPLAPTAAVVKAKRGRAAR